MKYPLEGAFFEPVTEAVLLVKPQFEVGRERVGKGGVVRVPAAHADAIAAVAEAAAPLGWQPQGLVGSPITGAAGNHEYLLWLGPEARLDQQTWPELITAVVQRTTA